MMIEKFIEYIEKLINILNPKKVLFLSLDGIAPMCKMKQQKLRRFRSSKQRKNLQNLEMKYREMLEGKFGHDVDDEKVFNDWDTNSISPGTVFMENVCKGLNEWAKEKSKSYPFKIVISGSNTPGEGEQKIVDYMRNLRTKKDYDPNTSHCLIGLDADFILLGLSLHEPHVHIYREKDKKKKQKKGKEKHTLLNIYTLRECLGKEFFNPNLGKLNDIERIIDDFVFFVNFFGNDFLPPLPFFDLLNNDLDLVIDYYKEFLWQAEDYMVNRENLNLKEIQRFLSIIVQHEKNYVSFIEKRKLTPQRVVDIKPKSVDELIEFAVNDFDNSNDVIVKNIPFEATEKTITKFFGQFGEVVQVNIMKKGKKCFLRFKTAEAVEKVCTVGEFKLEGKTLSVIKAEFINKNVIILENLSKSISRKDVFAIFSSDESKPKFKVKRVDFFRAYSCKVEFESEEIVEQVVKEYQGYEFKDTTIKIRKSDYIDHQSFKKKMEKLEANYERIMVDNDIEMKGGSLYDTYLVDIANYKQKFYESKFEKGCGVKDICVDYLKGLKWVMNYYYTNECLSWKSFHYPHDYSPFVSDLMNISSFFDSDEKLNIEAFSTLKDEPFYPLEQLLLILPKESHKLLPESYQSIQNNEKYQDFFNTGNLKVDYYSISGVKVNSEWTGVTSLHTNIKWIDIIQALKDCQLSKDEKDRNSWKKNCLYSSDKEKPIIEFDIEVLKNDIYKSNLKNGVKRSKLRFCQKELKVHFNFRDNNRSKFK